MLQLKLDADEFRALVRDIVRATLAELQAAGMTLGASPDGPLVLGEPEAARRLGLKPHQLRDERLRGRVPFSRGPRNRVMYRLADLERYLATRRVEMSD